MQKIIVASLFLSVPNLGAALAQTKAPQSSPQVRYQKTTHYDFDNEKVEGTLVRPDSEIIDGLGRKPMQSLLTPRAHFIPEMVKSVEGL